jgi:hypothetical protein
MEDTVGRVTGAKMAIAAVAFVIVMGLAYASQYVDLAPLVLK